jgi:hypothetical protein
MPLRYNCTVKKEHLKQAMSKCCGLRDLGINKLEHVLNVASTMSSIVNMSIAAVFGVKKLGEESNEQAGRGFAEQRDRDADE